MSAERVELTVLGQTLTLRSEADPKYLRTLVAFLEERVSAMQSSGVRDPMKALILAALEIADELHRSRDDQARDSSDVHARLGALVELLDRVAPEGRADRPPERR
jgi:cell division protein ZapA